MKTLVKQHRCESLGVRSAERDGILGADGESLSLLVGGVARRCCRVTTLQNWWPFLEPPHVTDESSLPSDPNHESKTGILAHMMFDSV